LEKLGRKNYVAIFISISEKETFRRLAKRKMCQKCGKIFTAPKRKTCPKCGTNLITRADDRPEAIRQRLKLYREKTRPILDYYRKIKSLIKISGEAPIHKVHQDIIKSLKLKTR